MKKNEDTLEAFIRRNEHYGAGRIGSEYWATRKLDIKDVAKLVRKDLSGLAKHCKGLKTSVHIDRFAGGQSMRVTVKSLPKQGDPTVVYYQIRHILEKYNYDFSNAQYDYSNVRFYDGIDTPDRGTM